MKQQLIKGLLLGPLFLAFVTINAQAQSFVYTNNDPAGANSVTAFSVGPTGALTQVPGSPFATGGLGLAGGSAVTPSVVGTFLFVANGGSNDISVFSINPATGFLTPVPGSPFPTGSSGFYELSLAVTPNNRFLYAGNNGLGSNDISAFSIAANGALTPIAGSPFAAGRVRSGVRVSPDGRFLAAALGWPEAVGIFSIGPDGALTPVPGSPFPSPADGYVTFVDINCASNLLFASNSTRDGTNVDVFSIGSNGALTLVETSNNPGVGGNSVAVLSPNERFLFASNGSTNSVTVFNVATNGTLSLVAGSPFGGTGGEPNRVATNAAGTFLFTPNYDDSTVSSFSIGANGALTLAGNFPTGQPVSSGLTAIAAFPPKFCFDICSQADPGGPHINSAFYAGKLVIKGSGFVGQVQIEVNGVIVAVKDNESNKKIKIGGSAAALNIRWGDNRVRVINNNLCSLLVGPLL